MACYIPSLAVVGSANTSGSSQIQRLHLQMYSLSSHPPMVCVFAFSCCLFFLTCFIWTLISLTNCSLNFYNDDIGEGNAKTLHSHSMLLNTSYLSLGGIYLQGYMVREQPYGSKKSTIELKPPSDEFKTFYFCAENPNENKRWGTNYHRGNILELRCKVFLCCGSWFFYNLVSFINLPPQWYHLVHRFFLADASRVTRKRPKCWGQA